VERDLKTGLKVKVKLCIFHNLSERGIRTLEGSLGLVSLGFVVPSVATCASIAVAHYQNCPRSEPRVCRTRSAAAELVLSVKAYYTDERVDRLSRPTPQRLPSRESRSVPLP
jgi:hypothetical protein